MNIYILYCINLYTHIYMYISYYKTPFIFKQIFQTLHQERDIYTEDLKENVLVSIQKIMSFLLKETKAKQTIYF